MGGVCNPHEGGEKSKQATFYSVINNVLRHTQTCSMNIHIFCLFTCWRLCKQRFARLLWRVCWKSPQKSPSVLTPDLELLNKEAFKAAKIPCNVSYGGKYRVTSSTVRNTV